MIQPHLYRHDEIQTGRPFGCDVDENDWLWQGCGNNRLTGHHLRTAELLHITVPEMENRCIFQVLASQGKLVFTMGTCWPYYLVYDVAKRKCIKKTIPISNPSIWYGAKIPGGKILLYERRESKVLILDSPEAEPRIVQCPFPGQLAYGKYFSDGFVYSALTDPARLIRFDPTREKFVDVRAFPEPDSVAAPMFENNGVIYCPDIAKGRLLPFEIASGKYLPPIPTPDYRSLYGFIGWAFSFQGKGYFNLSTYKYPSRLDPETGKLFIPPDEHLSVDQYPHRFLDRFLVFDPKTKEFDYLIAPQQPDGIPLLCYSWSDGKRFAITGFVIPFGKPGEPMESTDKRTGAWRGSWIVLQNPEATEIPTFPPYDLQFDLKSHIGSYRRTYDRSLYLSKMPFTPPISNMDGLATHYMPGKSEKIQRRAAKTDQKAYISDIARQLTRHAESDAEKVRLIADFVQRTLYYNPIQVFDNSDPVAVIESHDARCGQGVDVTLALLEAAGIPARRVSLQNHVVAEATYDGGDHIVDALFFGAEQPHRNGHVLSVAELKADPYFADAFPQKCFAYDPELLQSADGFWIQGYVFGIWGSEPYYSYYLGASKEHPPTIPLALPAERMGEDCVRLNWAKSIKYGGGEVEYEVRIFADRTYKEVVKLNYYTEKTSFLFNVVEEKCTKETSLLFKAPEKNRMYFVEVRAVDDHRKKNPSTWYPASRSNFVLVPKEQYGWYGLL